MKIQLPFILLLLCYNAFSYGQSPEYLAKKQKKMEEGSPFTRIINRELPATILYEDDDMIAFIPLKEQAKVHLLIVPKKEIPTLNEATGDDALLLGNMILLAARLARDNGISESGYRLALNVNEDAGQSVFHIHMHLLGGNSLGPMVEQRD